MRKAFVIADSKEACMKESGDLIISKVCKIKSYCQVLNLVDIFTKKSSLVFVIKIYITSGGSVCRNR